MNFNSKIYVAGHNGFVGRSLIKKLEEKQYNNIITATRKVVDLTHQNDVRKFFNKKKPEYVFICAAKVGGIRANMENPAEFLLENLQIQNNLLQAGEVFDIKKVLCLGSSCIYPKDYQQPLKEEYLLQAPVEPTNEGYALAKICGLKLCEYYNKDKEVPRFLSLMPCNLYGPGDCFHSVNSHVLSALVKKFVDAKMLGKDRIEVWGTGKARREFLFIDDLISGMLWSMNNIDNQTFLNIGTGTDISIKRLATAIAGFIDFRGKIVFDRSKPDGMLAKCLDVQAINDLGWKSNMKFEDGLIHTIDYYKSIIGV